MKIVSLVGARPQFIKEAVIHKALQEAGIAEIIVHSGQHYDWNMSDVFFSVLNIRKPDYNLEVGSGSHAYQTGTTMMRFEEVLLKEKPDAVLVYGDTNTTVAGAIAGAKLKIPVGHVEAGLRQEPKTMPEELNRILTDHSCDWLFCPSQLAVDNLKREGLEDKAFFTGDVMYDLFLAMSPFANVEAVLKRFNLKENEFVLVTIHRDFNTDVPETLQKIVHSLKKLSKDISVLFPTHPRVRKRIQEFNINTDGITMVEPVDYLTILSLLKSCAFVITDSGGLQKEAYFAGKRAIVVMPDTGWRELTDIGWNLLSLPEDISNAINEILQPVDPPKNIYGDGNAAHKIVSTLEEAIG